MSKFVEFSHSFNDPWGDNPDEATEISFRFSKPTVAQIKRLQSTAGKNASQASRDLLLSTVNEEDKEALKIAMEDYPGIVTTLSSAMLKGVGISSDLGN